MELSTRTRRTLSTVLAVFLAVESVSAVAAAAATRTLAHQLPADPPAGQVLAAEAAPGFVPGPAVETSVVVSAPRSAPRVVEPPEPTVAGPTVAEPVRQAAAAAAGKAKPTILDTATPARQAKAGAGASGTAASAKADKAPSGSRKASYSGTNHVWIPALGISRSVRWFPCDRSRPPDNYMYRWGCAGANNVYLMGHAYSVMEPLHDAYVSGRLAKGMRAWYADPNGKVRVYAVRWWKVTKPTTDAAWAWAAQDVPSMTLQTCVGRNSEYRLMVRLVEVNP